MKKIVSNWLNEFRNKEFTVQDIDLAIQKEHALAKNEAWNIWLDATMTNEEIEAHYNNIAAHVLFVEELKKLKEEKPEIKPVSEQKNETVESLIRKLREHPDCVDVAVILKSDIIDELKEHGIKPTEENISKVANKCGIQNYPYLVMDNINESIEYLMDKEEL